MSSENNAAREAAHDSEDIAMPALCNDFDGTIATRRYDLRLMFPARTWNPPYGEPLQQSPMLGQSIPPTTTGIERRIEESSAVSTRDRMLSTQDTQVLARRESWPQHNYSPGTTTSDYRLLAVPSSIERIMNRRQREHIPGPYEFFHRQFAMLQLEKHARQSSHGQPSARTLPASNMFHTSHHRRSETITSPLHRDLVVRPRERAVVAADADASTELSQHRHVPDRQTSYSQTQALNKNSLQPRSVQSQRSSDADHALHDYARDLSHALARQARELAHRRGRESAAAPQIVDPAESTAVAIGDEHEETIQMTAYSRPSIARRRPTRLPASSAAAEGESATHASEATNSPVSAERTDAAASSNTCKEADTESEVTRPHVSSASASSTCTSQIPDQLPGSQEVSPVLPPQREFRQSANPGDEVVISTGQESRSTEDKSPVFAVEQQETEHDASTGSETEQAVPPADDMRRVRFDEDPVAATWVVSRLPKSKCHGQEGPTAPFGASIEDNEDDSIEDESTIVGGRRLRKRR